MHQAQALHRAFDQCAVGYPLWTLAANLFDRAEQMKDSHKAWPGVLKARLKVLEAQLGVLEALLKTMRFVRRFLETECKPITLVMETLSLSPSLTELDAWLALLNVPEDRQEDKWALRALLKAPVALL